MSEAKPNELAVATNTALRECRRLHATARADYWWPFYLRLRRLAASELQLMGLSADEQALDAYLDQFALAATGKKLLELFERDRSCRQQLAAAGQHKACP